MAFKLFKQRWQNVTVIVVAAFLALVLVLALFANSVLSPIVAGKIKNGVLKGSDSLYKIEFSDLKLNILKGQAILYDIKLSTDTAVYKQKKLKGDAPTNLYQLHVNRLVVSHIQLLTLYFKKQLNIGVITLNAPDVEVSYHPNKRPDTVKKDGRTVWQKISKTFKQVQVSEINLNDIKLKYKDYTGPKVAVSLLKQMSLNATDLLIDSTTQSDTSRFFYCRDVTTQLHNYSRPSADGLYMFKVKSAKLSTQTSRLTVTGVSLIPKDHQTFFDKSQDDLFVIKMDSMVCSNFNYKNYQDRQELDVAKIIISKGFFEDFSNYNGQLKTTDRVVTFPNWALQNMVKNTINVDTLDLKHFDVSYKQFDTKKTRAGQLLFTNTRARFLNITNKKERIAKNSVCTAKLTTYFMGKGRFDLSFNFTLGDASYGYNYKGHLGPMDIAIANPAIVPLGLVKITSGRVKSLDFDMHSTRKMSAGKVSLLYNDLKVEVLRENFTAKPVVTLLANTFIIKHDNPDDGSNSPRLANVVLLRPASFPFFKTVWLTVLTGLKSCAGIGKAQEEKFKQQSAEDNKKEQEQLLKDARKRKEKDDENFKKQLKEKKKAA